MERESLSHLLDSGVSIQKIAKRFGKDPSTVAYWVRKHGLASPYRDRHAAKGPLARERLEALVEAGCTINEIASEVDRSAGTVRHWLKEYGLQTVNGRGRRPKAVWEEAKAAGKLEVTMVCRRHGETVFCLEGRGYYRCKRCRAEHVATRRRTVKGLLIAEAGGACRLCGYDRCARALQFHHLDPENKKFGIGLRGVARSIDRARAEAAKCVLLCANCHAEVEAGFIELPATVPRDPRNSPTS